MTDFLFSMVAGLATIALGYELAERRGLTLFQRLGLLAFGVLVIQALLVVINGG